MGKTNTYDLCVQHLFDDKDKLTHLAPQLLDRLMRIRSGYMLMLEYPSKGDREILEHLMKFADVKKSQAYEDLRIIRDLLGSINKQSKDWHRYKLNLQVQRAFDRAEQKDQPQTMVDAMKIYGKYNQLDKDEQDRIPWEQIIPQMFEPTEDPSVIGIKPIPDFKKRQASLYKKYMNDLAQDVTYHDVDLKALEL